MLSSHLEQSRSDLIDHFNANYANAISVPSSSCSASVQSLPMAAGSPQKSFTARYRRKEKNSINELEEYFKLPAEDFNSCNPIHWWIGQWAQFPNLFCMARDILCIPGALSVLYSLLFLTYLQAPLLLLRGYSQMVATPYPSGVLVSMPILFVPLCLLRSDYISSMPKLTLPCVVEVQDRHPTPFQHLERDDQQGHGTQIRTSRKCTVLICPS